MKIIIPAITMTTTTTITTTSAITVHEVVISVEYAVVFNRSKLILYSLIIYTYYEVLDCYYRRAKYQYLQYIIHENNNATTYSSSYFAIIAICTQVFNIPQIKYYILIVGLQV